MSAGSKIVPVRLPPGILEAMQEQIARMQDRVFDCPPNISDFIRSAIKEKLAHMERSRRPGRRKKKEVVYEG